MKRISFLFLLIFSIASSYGQTAPHRCGTMEHLKHQIEKDPGITIRMQQYEQVLQQKLSESGVNANYIKAAGAGDTIKIPVVVHVVYNLNKENITDAQILSQMYVLNQDYNRLNPDTVNTPPPFRQVAGKMNIQFILASIDPQGNPTSGITRKKTTVTSFNDYDNGIKYDSSGGTNAWDTRKYLNLWVGNLGDGFVLGYAQFPGTGAPETDGVAIHYTNFGTTGTAIAPYNKGRTVTHEVGHWLNLLHTWGDDSGTCASDDGINDTPKQASENYTIPVFPKYDACTNNGNGIMYMNYMDYTDDAGMNMFSQGQVTRMGAAMQVSPRSDLETDAARLTKNGQGLLHITTETVREFNFYPNPSKGFINVSGVFPTGFKLRIYNIIGSEVYYKEFSPYNQNAAYTVDLTDKPNGTYFIYIQTNNSSAREKIILVR